MALSAGSRLGPYEITLLLGAGGMGEVYRARDTRLGRDVAVKVLTEAHSTDPHALERFETEARAVAALSHPNILALFDIGQAGGTTYIVTELLDGETIRDRLASGPLPARKALDYARQTADALAAAHERGIVHRDLKPDNLFVTPDGRVKVFDFGLARMALPPIDGNATIAPAERRTSVGVIMGTIGYMAPEQVRGQPVDHRADIFALGAVLFEMLTGTRAFGGDTSADVISAILHADPPTTSSTHAAVPPGVDRIVRRCLEKSPTERFQSARDLAFAIDAASGAATTPQESAPTRRRFPVLATVAVGVAALVVGAYVAGRAAVPAPAPQLVAQFGIPSTMSWSDAASVSPDGMYVAYTGDVGIGGAAGGGSGPLGRQFAGFASLTAGSARFWLRRLDSLTAHPLSNTDQAFPVFFWSPDGKYIGYFGEESIIIREVPDGAPRALAAVQGRPLGATWNARGTILFATTEGVFQIDQSSGMRSTIMTTKAGREVWRGYPSFLPDGTHFLFSVLLNTSGPSALETRVGTLNGADSEPVLRGAVGTMYVNGYVIFGSGSALYAQRFDPSARRVIGDRVEIAKSVTQDWRNGQLAARASDNGVLVVRGEPKSDMQFTWFDRAGHAIGTVGAPDSFTNFSLSPNEKRIAATRRDPLTGQTTLWLIDTARGVTTLVSSKDDTDDYEDPTWAPDGEHLVYNHGNEMLLRTANGGTPRQLIDAPGFPDSFSSDGRYVTYGLARANVYELWALDITTPGASPIALVSNVTLADESRISPNGRWFAYHANETGTTQVCVQPFPPTGERWQISKEGGVQPRWSTDGNELFFLNADGQLMAVTMPQSDPRQAGAATPLFATGLIPSNALDQFAVGRDRFLVRVPVSGDANAAAIQVVVNWPAAAGLAK